MAACASGVGITASIFAEVLKPPKRAGCSLAKREASIWRRTAVSPPRSAHITSTRVPTLRNVFRTRWQCWECRSPSRQLGRPANTVAALCRSVSRRSGRLPGGDGTDRRVARQLLAQESAEEAAPPPRGRSSARSGSFFDRGYDIGNWDARIVCGRGAGRGKRLRLRIPNNYTQHRYLLVRCQ